MSVIYMLQIHRKFLIFRRLWGPTLIQTKVISYFLHQSGTARPLLIRAYLPTSEKCYSLWRLLYVLVWCWGMLLQNYKIKNMMRRKFSTCERCFSQKKNIAESLCSHHTVDGSEILLTSWYVVYPIIYGGLYIPGGWEWDFFHQQYFDFKTPTLWTLQASSCYHWEEKKLELKVLLVSQCPTFKGFNLEGVGATYPPKKVVKVKNCS